LNDITSPFEIFAPYREAIYFDIV